MRRIDLSGLDVQNLQDRTVKVKRVVKVVKGGRTSSISTLVIVGDGNGYVGVGLGKAAERAEAEKKGREDAKKNMIYVERNDNNSVYHQITGHFGGSNVLIKPAPEGTGVIAGGAVRAVMELAGIKNVITKAIGSSNHRNVVNAAFNGLKEIKTPQKVARLRGKSVEEILG